MEDLPKNLISYIGVNFLLLRDIVSLSAVSTTLHRLIGSNEGLWLGYCIKMLGSKAPKTRKEQHATIGLAQTVLSWREFFISTYSSCVLTWGESGGRTGHANRKPLSFPKVLPSLSGKGVSFIGKTAEVGSICISFGGQVKVA